LGFGTGPPPFSSHPPNLMFFFFPRMGVFPVLHSRMPRSPVPFRSLSSGSRVRRGSQNLPFTFPQSGDLSCFFFFFFFFSGGFPRSFLRAVLFQAPRFEFLPARSPFTSLFFYFFFLATGGPPCSFHFGGQMIA